MSHFHSTLRCALVLLLPGLLLLCLTGCGTQAQNTLKVQQNLEESLRYAQVEPTDTKARQWADQAIAVAPNDPEVYFGPRTLNPNTSLPQLSIFAVFTVTGDNPALADYMTQAVKKFPNDERGFQILAQTQGQLGRTAAQKATAASLVALLNKKLQTPGATDIQTLTTALAQAYFDAGDPASGTAAYKKAIGAYPAAPDPLNGLAYAEAVHGINLPEALSLAQKAVALARKKGASDEELAAYLDTLGWVQFQQGHPADAEQSLLPAADSLPRLAEIRYHLGRVYAAQGKTEAARAELGHAVLLTQGYAAAQSALDSLPQASSSKPSPMASSVPKSAPSPVR